MSPLQMHQDLMESILTSDTLPLWDLTGGLWGSVELRTTVSPSFSIDWWMFAAMGIVIFTKPQHAFLYPVPKVCSMPNSASQKSVMHVLTINLRTSFSSWCTGKWSTQEISFHLSLTVPCCLACLILGQTNECVSLLSGAGSGYTGVYANGDGEKGLAACPFEFYNTWVNDPLEAQRMSEKVTRSTIGVACCPVAGIPAPNEEEAVEALTFALTNELNLT